MGSEELKNCPFCNGEAEIERFGNTQVSNIVSCTDCGAGLESGDTFNPTASWNRRANTTPITPEVRERMIHAAAETYCRSSGEDVEGEWMEKAIDAAIQVLQSGGRDESN